MRGWARLMCGTRQPAPAPDVCVIAVCMQASKDAAIAEGADLAKGQKLSHQQAEAAARRAVRIEEKAARARESRMLAGVLLRDTRRRLAALAPVDYGLFPYNP